MKTFLLFTIFLFYTGSIVCSDEYVLTRPIRSVAELCTFIEEANNSGGDLTHMGKRIAEFIALYPREWKREITETLSFNLKQALEKVCHDVICGHETHMPLVKATLVQERLLQTR